jgi:prolipoprotein diacylglyceryltransferase
MLPVLGVLWLPSLPFWAYSLLVALLLLSNFLLFRRWGRSVSISCSALLLLVLFFILRSLPSAALAVNTFGIVISVAFLCGFLFFVLYGRRLSLDIKESSEIVLASAVVGLICAQLGFVLIHQEGSLQFFHGGLSSGAGLLGGILYAWWFSSRRGISLRELAHPAALGLLLALSIGKIGCLLHGCDFGAPTDSFVAITYPAEWTNLLHQEGALQSPLSLYQHSEAFAARFPEWVSWLPAYDDRSQGAPLSLPVHPLPLYEAVGTFILFFLVGVSAVKAKKTQANIGLFALVGYALLRFVCDFFRGDDEPLFFSLTLVQWLSLLVLLGVVLWRLLSRRRRVGH